MLKQLNYTDLISAIQKRIEENTGIRCYDMVPINAPSPFYYVEITGKRKSDTKTMFCETYNVMIHALSKASSSSVGIFDLINKLEESMTEDIVLPEGFNLIMQTQISMNNLKTEETKEKHAIFQYDFKISYGFKCK